MLAVNHVAASEALATKAVLSLQDEALLTPKPGLVDASGAGSHQDMTIELMLKSANALKPAFQEIAHVSYRHQINQALREQIASIGRSGEQMMLSATHGVNTHKGAIWALGLLVSARAAAPEEYDPIKIMRIAGKLASYEDRYAPNQHSNGQAVKQKYKIIGAAEEAKLGFPHIREASLPTLLKARACGKTEEEARIEALLSLIATVDDTCVLHRGNGSDLKYIKQLSAAILAADGFRTYTGRKLFDQLSEYCKVKRLSPGGSADLLAATIFLLD